MAYEFLDNVSLNLFELQNAKLQSLAARPTGVQALVIFNTATVTPEVYDGTGWIPLDARKFTNAIPTTAILNFDATIRAYRLDQFAAPTAAVLMGGQLVSNVADPVGVQDAATKNYVDTKTNALALGIRAVKDPARVRATAQTALSGLVAIDGVTLVDGDRVLLTAQTAPAENFLWVAHTGAWTRPTDANTGTQLEEGTAVLVNEGTTGTGTQWRITTTGAITVGTTAITVQNYGSGSTYTAGNGLSLTGNTFSVNPAAGGGILVGAGGVSVDTSVVTRKFSATIGDGAASSFTVTHNLGTQDVTVSVRRLSDQKIIGVGVIAASVNTVTVTFGSVPAAGAFRVTVHG